MAAGTVYHLHSGVTFLVNRVDGAGKAGKQEKDHTRTLRSKSGHNISFFISFYNFENEGVSCRWR